eukprot:SAG31_NODE_25932_length_451_cov_0.954545_2_plen_58_part_01
MASAYACRVVSTHRFRLNLSLLVCSVAESVVWCRARRADRHSPSPDQISEDNTLETGS